MATVMKHQQSIYAAIVLGDIYKVFSDTEVFFIMP